MLSDIIGDRHLRILNVLAALFVLWILVSCVPEDKSVSALPLRKIDFHDAEIQRLWNFIDQRQLDSSKVLLSHENPTYRLLALRGLSTIKNTTLTNDVINLLMDSDEILKESAVFSLGQIGDGDALIPLTQAFVSSDSLGEELLLNNLILEALGKIGDAEVEINIASVKTYTSKDTALVEGQVKSLYRFATRGITSPEAIDQIMSILNNSSHTSTARLMAAHYLGRAPSLDLNSYDEGLRAIGLTDKDPYIRMAIATAFKHLQSEFGFQTLIDWLGTETDDRVRVNVLRSLVKYTDRKLNNTMLPLLSDTSANIAEIASIYLLNNLTSPESVPIRRKARSMSKDKWRLKANLYAAANKNLSNRYSISKVNMNNEIESHYRNAQDPYEKAAYIKAWSQYAGNIDNLILEYKNTKSEVVKSTILENLLETTSATSINKVYSGMKRTALLRVRDLIVYSISSGNASAIALACDWIERNYDYWRPYFANFDFLQSGIGKLVLPRDYEASLSAKKLLHKVSESDKNFKNQHPADNHPIDWTVIDELRDTVRIEVQTSIGTFSCHLYLQVAPGAVANFVQLSKSNFYNGKAFHRVVPNFVIQTGCPIGNGYGSLDYSIRSEYSDLRYDKEGVIGMASVGPDTEGTQWFVTHSPTPHLDGKYTIFGQVVEGMDVVHAIQVGDKIETIKILN